MNYSKFEIGCTGQLFIWLLIIFSFLMSMGNCEQEESKRRLENNLLNRKKGGIPDLGVEKSIKPTKYLRYKTLDPDCLSKEEFYQGMENAEMRGEADDPSAQDIYDEFNR